MPIIIGAFCVLPLLLGLAIEYPVCRFARHKIFRLLPPALCALAAVLIGVGRYRLWSSPEASPRIQLLIFPGLPAAAMLAGMYLSYRLYRRRWGPRVVDDPYL